jgi:hypothetical protein
MKPSPPALKKIPYISLILVAMMILPFVVAAQEKEEDELSFPLDNFYAKRKKNPVRGILKDFHFSGSIGYGNTFFHHKLNGFGVVQSPGYPARIFDANPGVGTIYSNWVNGVAGDTVGIKPGSFLASSDTTKLGFKAHALNIPLKLTVHYEFKQKYRIGGGYSWEYMSIGQFKPITYNDNIGHFTPSGATGFMKKYFGMVGYSFLRLGDYLFTGDLNIGGFKPGKNFDNGLIKKGMYGNLGVTVERELSEYLRLFVRPSYDIKSYTLNIPESNKSIKHNINAFYINVGVTYSLPELPRCYNKDCHAQINHAHGDREYRSRMHKIWKWQNPNYGQNNPKLIKYKGKNKKKLNPY